MEMDLHIRGRLIAPEDLALIRQLLATEGHLGRTHLSQRLCRLWSFPQANGAYRAIACRDWLRQLEARGLIVLPLAQSGTQARLAQPNLPSA